MLKHRGHLSAFVVAASLVAGLGGCSFSPVPFEGSEASEPVAQQQVEPKPDAQQPQQDRKGTTLDDGGTQATPEPQGEVAPDADGFALTTMADESEMGMVPTEYPPEFNTEEYGAVNESGFVSTVTSPLSTVSADVDTASYANLRRMLRAGYQVPTGTAEPDPKTVDGTTYEEYGRGATAYDVIPAGAVRIEEMLNYFDYAYPAPQGDESFSVTARVGACPWNKDTQLLVLGSATAPEDTAAAQKGANLVFLIDVSGSMDEPNKLPLLQKAFERLVRQLDEKDRVSIVTYSGEEQVVMDGESGANQREILRAIRRLKAEGSTNGEAGLRMAYDLAQDHFIKDGVNRIVMASDGDLNVGMTSESDLHDFVDRQRKTGVYLSVLGFGDGNYKDTKMETLADHGNGSYHYIDCEDEAERVFGSRLMANLVPFADDVKMQVEFNPAQVKGYRLIGYENRTMAAEDFKDDAKDAGEVGPQSQFTVVYEVVRADSAMDVPVPDMKYGKGDQAEASAETSGELCTAKLRYKPVDGGDVREQSAVVNDESFSDDPGEDWRLAAAVTEFGMLLRDSEHKGTSSYDDVRKLVGDAKDDQRKELLELVDLAENN